MAMISKTGNAIRRKITGKAGETIAETLFALLISALALIMLVGAISAAGNIITRSEDTMESYYAGISDLGKPKQPGFTVSLKTEDEEEILLSNGDDSGAVYYAVNNAFKSKPVLSYSSVPAT